MGSYNTIVVDEDDVPTGGVRRAQNLLDLCADGVLDCVSYADGLRARRPSKGLDGSEGSGATNQIPMEDVEP